MFLGKQISEFFDPENLPQPPDQEWGEKAVSVQEVFEASCAAGLRARNHVQKCDLEHDTDMPLIEELLIDFASPSRKADYLGKTIRRGNKYTIRFFTKTFESLFSNDVEKFKEEVRVTLIHEFCHIFTMTKEKASHGPLWKQKMIEYGLPPSEFYTGCPCERSDLFGSPSGFCPPVQS
jgi:hypothetical protein